MPRQFRVINDLPNNEFGFQVVNTQTGQIIRGPIAIGQQQDAANLLNALRSNTTDEYFNGLMSRAGANADAIASIQQLQQDTMISWGNATQLGYDFGEGVEIMFVGDDVTSLLAVATAAQGPAIDLASEVLDIVEAMELL